MQEIIVYRNPMEAAFWHMAGTGEFFAIACACVAGFVMFLILHSLVNRLLRPKGWTYGTRNSVATNAALLGGLAMALVVGYVMLVRI